MLKKFNFDTHNPKNDKPEDFRDLLVYFYRIRSMITQDIAEILLVKTLKTAEL